MAKERETAGHGPAECNLWVSSRWAGSLYQKGGASQVTLFWNPAPTGMLSSSEQEKGGLLQMSCDFPLVFLCFSSGFPMVVPWFPLCQFLWLPYGVHMVVL